MKQCLRYGCDSVGVSSLLCSFIGAADILTVVTTQEQWARCRDCTCKMLGDAGVDGARTVRHCVILCDIGEQRGAVARGPKQLCVCCAAGPCRGRCKCVQRLSALHVCRSTFAGTV